MPVNEQIFGKIIFGLEVLDIMEKTPCDAKDKPVSDIKITGISILANPFASKRR